MAYRKEKIEEQMRRLISELLIKDIKDPRIEKALKHLVNLKSFKKNSPGSYNEAYEILQKYKNI